MQLPLQNFRKNAHKSLIHMEAASPKMRNRHFGVELGRKTEIQLGILQAEQKARDDESARASEVMEREAEIANKERALQQQQRRLDAEWKELERERVQIREDSLREASQEIARLTDARLRAEARLEKVYRDWTLTEQKLEQYREFSEALAGRSAREILDELAAQKRRVTQLENQIANSQDDQLQFENEALRKLRDEQKAQLDEVHLGLADPRWPGQIPPPLATPNSPRQDDQIMTTRV